MNISIKVVQEFPFPNDYGLTTAAPQQQLIQGHANPEKKTWLNQIQNPYKLLRSRHKVHASEGSSNIRIVHGRGHRI